MARHHKEEIPTPGQPVKAPPTQQTTALNLIEMNRPMGPIGIVTGTDSQGGRLPELVPASHVTHIADAPVAHRFEAEEAEDEFGEPLKSVEPPKRTRYRVTVGGMAHDLGGLPAKINPGKVIDSVNYDVDSLRAQGIQLVAIDD